MKYPDTRKIWNGYTHSNTSTLQDEINTTYSRVGQICKDNSGSLGSILAEYDFAGSGRFVRRVHDEVSGAVGNDTRVDLWHGASGQYDGLDQFGRIKDIKYTDFSGGATDFARRKYTHDRNSNRLSIEDTLYKAESQSFTYDNLNRLTDAKRGILNNSSAVQLSDVVENYNMDLLGNFTSAAGGIKINGTSSTVTHAVNATNELTTIDVPAPSGAARAINEPFTSSLSSFWSQDKGTWSISSNQVNVDTLTSSAAVLLADATLDIMNYEVTVTFPTSSSTNKAALVFAHNGSNSYYAVTINRSTGKLVMYQVSSGTWGGVLGTAQNVTINDSTAYTLRVLRSQTHVEAWVVGQEANRYSYSGSTDFGTGKSGVFSDKTNVTFDNFKATVGTARDPKMIRQQGVTETTLSAGVLSLDSRTYGGVNVIEGYSGTTYTVQVDVDPNVTGTDVAEVWIHYRDPNNGYRVTFFTATGDIVLDRFKNGIKTQLDVAVVGTPISVSSVNYVPDGGNFRIKVYVNGSLTGVNVIESQIPSGMVALSGQPGSFDNLMIGTDANADGDLYDGGDTIRIFEDFDATSASPAYDHAGNLIDDTTFQFVYDAWNRLIKVRGSVHTATTIQTAEFDATGRRTKKVVTNSGDLDGTTVFYYDGDQIIEARDGSGNVRMSAVQNSTSVRCLGTFSHVGICDANGCCVEVAIYYDAGGNPVVVADQGGNILERYVYNPYGDVTVHQYTGFGDYDGDGDVDANDKAALLASPPGICRGSNPAGACRILDFDQNNVINDDDEDCLIGMPQGLARHPGLSRSGIGQPFLFQGLWFDPEIGVYDNRRRHYHPAGRRFLQRDPLTFENGAGLGYGDGLSLYGYVRQNPVMFQDPSGAFVSSLNAAEDMVEVGVNTVFWGAGANPLVATEGFDELTQLWNGNGTRPPILHVTDASRQRSARFTFTNTYELTPGAQSICCNQEYGMISGPYGQVSEAWATPCADALEARYPNHLFVYVRRAGDCGDPDHSKDNSQGQQVADSGLFGSMRHVHVERAFISPGCSNANVLSHEVGHLMGGQHGDENSHGLGHIMAGGSWNRAVHAHNIVDVLNRHSRPESGLRPQPFSPRFDPIQNQWSCTDAACQP